MCVSILWYFIRRPIEWLDWHLCFDYLAKDSGQGYLMKLNVRGQGCWCSLPGFLANSEVIAETYITGTLQPER